MSRVRHHGGVRLIALAALLLLAVSRPAFAEICDKAVGEDWRRAHGPVWLLNPVGFPFGMTILLVALVLVARAKRSWPGYVAAALAVASAASLALVDVIPDHDIYRMQVREGCRSFRTDVMQIALLVSFALAFGWLGFRSAVKNAKAIRP